MEILELNILILCHNEGDLIFDTYFALVRTIENFRIHFGKRSMMASMTLVLDNATNATLESAKRIQSITAIETKIIEVSFSDPGLSRNAGIETCPAEYLLIIDGDDLLSDDFISVFWAMPSKNLIYHPEYLVNFGEKNLVWRQPRSHRIDQTKAISVCFNPYDTCSIGLTSHYQKIRYHEARQSEGYGYEDWHFTLESNFYDIGHDILPGTIKYTRIKPSSRMKTDRRQCSMLPYSAYLDLITSSILQ